MKRRQFLTTACAAGLAAASMRTAPAAEPSGNPYFLDFRIVTAPNAQRLETMIKQNGEVTMPTINKYGISPVGLFVANPILNVKDPAYDKKYDHVLFGVIPHSTFDAGMELAEKMRGDTQYRESLAAASQGSTPQSPMFTVHDRSLLRCFPEFPEIKVPSLAPNRILQLRIYRSFNFERNRAAINQIVTPGGGLDLFAECGIKPVFCATTLYGTFIPSFTLLFNFESEEQMRDAWAKFVNHPGWLKLKNDPAYADTATETINVYLKPCKGSQI